MSASWESQGLWQNGDLVLMASVVALFSLHCLSGPTATTIAATIAATQAKNADGTIMGLQQMCQSTGQAIGPVIAGALYMVNMHAAFLYVACFEVLSLSLNIFVFLQARHRGSIERGLFSLCEVIQLEQMPSSTTTQTPKLEAEGVEEIPEPATACTEVSI